MIPANKLASRSFIFCVLIVVLFLIWDFTSRVWLPIETEEPGTTARFDPQQAMPGSDYDLPPYLSAWLNSVESVPDESATEGTDTNVQETLPGSNEFGNFRLRIRGVFSSASENGESRAMAIAERQDVESGEISRVTLTLHEQLGGDYYISQIGSGRVTIRHIGEGDEVTLLVFDPALRAQQQQSEVIDGEEGLLIPQTGNDLEIEESATTHDIKNLVDFIRLCISKPDLKTNVYNIADAESLTIGHIVATLQKGMQDKGWDTKVQQFYCPHWLLKLVLNCIGKQQVYEQLFLPLQVDTSKAQRDLNWAPPVSAEAGLYASGQQYVSVREGA